MANKKKREHELDDHDKVVSSVISNRGKRLRRDPSAASIQCPKATVGEPTSDATKPFDVSNDENATNIVMTEDVDVDRKVEEDQIRKDLEGAVRDIQEARPVGGKTHLNAVHQLRHILSTYEEPPYKIAVESGAIPVLIEALQPPQMDSVALETTFQASWALTNLAVGTSQVVEAIIPAAPILIAHIGGDGGFAMAEQCAWAIGNMGEEDVEYRAILIANGAVKPLIRLFTRACASLKQGKESKLDKEGLSAGETAAWALSILFKGEGEEVNAFFEIDGAMEAVMTVLTSQIAPVALVQETSWLLSRVTCSCSVHRISEDQRRSILDAEAMQLRVILDTCQGEDVSVLIPILRVFGNIASYAGPEAEEFFSSDPGYDAIDVIVMCGSTKQYGVEREVAWALRGICQLGHAPAMFVKKSSAIPLLKKYLKEEPFHVKKEAAGVLISICSAEKDPGELLNHLFAGDEVAIVKMLSLMKAAHKDSIELGIQFVKMMLQYLPKGKEVIEHAGGIKALEEVQYHEGVDGTSKEQAKILVNEYWSV